jgi:hypothetical protein
VFNPFVHFLVALQKLGRSDGRIATKSCLQPPDATSSVIGFVILFRMALLRFLNKDISILVKKRLKSCVKETAQGKWRYVKSTNEESANQKVRP